MKKATPGDPEPLVVPARRGLFHVIDATRYSLAGMRRLARESAARLEFLAAGGAALGFLWRGAEPWHWAALVALVALVLAIEAINTALEILVDRVSPEWSLMAKEAKDLGSLAVGLMLLVSAGFVALVMTGVI
ncbi:diacylglycerol kinase (ATP) [Roseovarius halotolerans]|uniref:Diacylglycerol kinase n=1 Tax=Roseovarius halotolerans TaxID=505353 RepID=A0A1X6Y8P0_9RHOB|nr:diacylglycerol kinase [Roseovarius halotolerans]RKT35114.1 diacylglycerol kinase (ATP) [Roseovarius halotolerans]SLN13590.1 Diacylglycerol kinase [Roseovarius halotolerans]